MPLRCCYSSISILFFFVKKANQLLCALAIIVFLCTASFCNSNFVVKQIAAGHMGRMSNYLCRYVCSGGEYLVINYLVNRKQRIYKYIYMYIPITVVLCNIVFNRTCINLLLVDEQEVGGDGGFGESRSSQLCSILNKLVYHTHIRAQE